MNTDPLSFNHVLFYGRDYDEVLRMVALKESDLRGQKILDCPSGPDAFVAGAARRGFDIVGCDPIYEKPPGEAVAQGWRDISLAFEKMRGRVEENAGLDIDAFTGRKFHALKEFAADFPAGLSEGRYVVASLPNLPFANRNFDLVISANFLFGYSSTATGGLSTDGRFDLDFHRAAVHELVRVCRGEVRLYPVMTYGTNRLHPYVAQIVGQLAADGMSLRLEGSDYEQGRITGHLVLIIDAQKCAPRT